MKGFDSGGEESPEDVWQVTPGGGCPLQHKSKHPVNRQGGQSGGLTQGSKETYTSPVPGQPPALLTPLSRLVPPQPRLPGHLSLR